jgi:hypothetical protein
MSLIFLSACRKLHLRSIQLTLSSVRIWVVVIQVFLWEMLLRRSVYNEGLYKAKPDSDKMIAWV